MSLEAGTLIALGLSSLTSTWMGVKLLNKYDMRKEKRQARGEEQGLNQVDMYQILGTFSLLVGIYLIISTIHISISLLEVNNQGDDYDTTITSMTNIFSRLIMIYPIAFYLISAKYIILIGKIIIDFMGSPA